jgi:hypothetical protein
MCDCTGAGINTIYEHRTLSACSTTCSSMQRWRQVRHARFRSRIRMRSSQSTRWMIAPGLDCGLVKISPVTACCGRIDLRLPSPSTQWRGRISRIRVKYPVGNGEISREVEIKAVRCTSIRSRRWTAALRQVTGTAVAAKPIWPLDSKLLPLRTGHCLRAQSSRQSITPLTYIKVQMRCGCLVSESGYWLSS